jgi:tetratricopeptide (TPR) repeat protein
MNRLFALGMSLVLAVPGVAQNPDSVLEKGRQLLLEARTTLDDKALAEASQYFTQLAQKDPNNPQFQYYLARVQSYRTDFYDNRQQRKQAEKALDEAIAAAQRAVGLDDKAAEFHSLLGELYGRKIGFGGFFTAMRYGPRANAETERALALDPNNPRAHACLGRKYLFSPRMFGGDIDKAVASFRKATELDPAFDENFVWLSIAYRKKGEPEAADRALQEALRLNPRSEFVRRNAPH